MKIAVLLATGYEEGESLFLADILMRGGFTCDLVSTTGEQMVSGCHGITVRADRLLDGNMQEYDMVILPGGMPGATNLYGCAALRKMLSEHYAKGGKIGAICASPAVVLGQMGFLEGKEATCYPGFEDMCKGAKMIDARGVVDGNIVTANGPSSTFNLDYEILKIELGKMRADKVMNDMLLYPQQKINEYY